MVPVDGIFWGQRRRRGKRNFSLRRKDAKGEGRKGGKWLWNEWFTKRTWRWVRFFKWREWRAEPLDTAILKIKRAESNKN